MRIRGRNAAFLVLPAMLAILAAGCGGEQAGGERDGRNTGEQVAGREPRTRIALGAISVVNAEERRLYLRPTIGEEVMRFRVMKGSGITLDGHGAALTSVNEGDQAKVEYVVVEDTNRAKALEVFGG